MVLKTVFLVIIATLILVFVWGIFKKLMKVLFIAGLALIIIAATAIFLYLKGLLV
jgi:hypothetical protein|tara:strand:+ start:95 stop:259 length:165 start_codon:yes stop_codon:yes gene_type:complete